LAGIENRYGAPVLGDRPAELPRMLFV